MHVWRPWYIEMLENEQRQLSRNSNGHNFLLGCPIQAHNISRRSNMNTKALGRFKRHNFWLGCINEAYDVWRRMKLNNRSTREIQMIITFHSDAWFRHIIYRNAQNWTRKILANSNGHKFWLGCMCDTHDILRRSKMNNRSSREIQMVITFHSDVRFRLIIYRDAWIWTRKLSTDSNDHNFWLGCMIVANDTSRRLNLNNRSSQEIQMAITFPTDFRFRPLICRDARN